MTTEGQGGSIPLCNVFAETFPDAEIMLMGVEEPKWLIHAPNESVDPSEIENIALAEALFLEPLRRDGRTMTAPARSRPRTTPAHDAGRRRPRGRADRRARHTRPGPAVPHGVRADRDHRAAHAARGPRGRADDDRPDPGTPRRRGRPAPAPSNCRLERRRRPLRAAAPLLDPTGRYAISDAAWAMHLLGLQSALPGASYVSMTAALPMLRA